MSVVRFRWVVPVGEHSDNPDETSPPTIYVGPGSAAPTDPHNATKDIQALLKKYEITDTVSIEFAEMFLKRVDGS